MCSGQAGSQDLPILEHNVSYASVIRVEGSDEENFASFSLEVAVSATGCSRLRQSFHHAKTASSSSSMLKQPPPPVLLGSIGDIGVTAALTNESQVFLVFCILPLISLGGYV